MMILPKGKRYPAIFSSVLASRSTTLCILGVSGLHLVLNFFRLPGWQCPISYGIGIPCPGCGLSRALVILLYGDWQTALTLHVFAPVLLLALLLIGWTGVLPKRYREKFIMKVERIECSTGISILLVIGLLVYWAVRLIDNPGDFITLIKGAFPMVH